MPPCVRLPPLELYFCGCTSERSTKDGGHAQACCNSIRPFHFKATYAHDFQDFLSALCSIINDTSHHIPTHLEQLLEKLGTGKNCRVKRATFLSMGCTEVGLTLYKNTQMAAGFKGMHN